jgi:hypothetical protein
MSWTAAPALTAILHDADRVAPGRSHASDGTVGDLTHQSQGAQSDHNPDANGVVHACDVTNDPAHFDSWHWGQVVADRIKAGQEHRVKYLVSNDGTKDVIFNPSVSMTWRQNGTVKQEHTSHLHVSILYTAAAENDTTPFFVSGAAPVVPPITPTGDDMFDDTDRQLLHDLHGFMSEIKGPASPTSPKWFGLVQKINDLHAYMSETRDKFSALFTKNGV